MCCGWDGPNAGEANHRCKATREIRVVPEVQNSGYMPPTRADGSQPTLEEAGLSPQAKRVGLRPPGGAWVANAQFEL